MKYIRDKNSNIPFSMHDSSITEISFANGELTFKLDKIFEYTNGEEKFYPAKIIFTEVDIEFCNVSVFDRALTDGDFQGHRYPITEYMEKFKNAEFRVLTEGYSGYDKTFVGWIWREDLLVSGFINIWTKGDMIYDVEL